MEHNVVPLVPRLEQHLTLLGHLALQKQEKVQVGSTRCLEKFILDCEMFGNSGVGTHHVNPSIQDIRF